MEMSTPCRLRICLALEKLSRSNTSSVLRVTPKVPSISEMSSMWPTESHSGTAWAWSDSKSVLSGTRRAAAKACLRRLINIGLRKGAVHTALGHGGPGNARYFTNVPLREGTIKRPVASLAPVSKVG